MDEYTREDYIAALAGLYMELLDERRTAQQARKMLREERDNVTRLSARVRELEMRYGKAAE